MKNATILISMVTISGYYIVLNNWLVAWNIFPYIGNFIIPTDFHSYFSEGWLNHQPDHQYITIPILTIYIYINHNITI